MLAPDAHGAGPCPTQRQGARALLVKASSRLTDMMSLRWLPHQREGPLTCLLLGTVLSNLSTVDQRSLLSFASRMTMGRQTSCVSEQLQSPYRCLELVKTFDKVVIFLFQDTHGQHM